MVWYLQLSTILWLSERLNVSHGNLQSALGCCSTIFNYRRPLRPNICLHRSILSSSTPPEQKINDNTIQRRDYKILNVFLEISKLVPSKSVFRPALPTNRGSNILIAVSRSSPFAVLNKLIMWATRNKQSLVSIKFDVCICELKFAVRHKDAFNGLFPLSKLISAISSAWENCETLFTVRANQRYTLSLSRWRFSHVWVLHRFRMPLRYCNVRSLMRWWFMRVSEVCLKAVASSPFVWTLEHQKRMEFFFQK